MGKRARVAGLVAVLVVALGGVVWLRASANREPVFCFAAGAGFEYEGEFYWLEDQGTPGRGGPCGDGRTAKPFERTVGFDCKVREPDGTVSASFRPNRSDGTCGQAEQPGRTPTR